MVFLAVTRAGYAHVGGTGQGPGHLDQACAADLAAVKLIEGRLADKACGSNAYAAIRDQDDIAVLKLQPWQAALVQEVIEIDVCNGALAALDNYMPEAAALR